MAGVDPGLPREMVPLVLSESTLGPAFVNLADSPHVPPSGTVRVVGGGDTSASGGASPGSGSRTAVRNSLSVSSIINSPGLG
jgi:hypothetical protein